jgi:hypothetical protein
MIRGEVFQATKAVMILTISAKSSGRDDSPLWVPI